MLKNLILERPLAAIDVETTGLIELAEPGRGYRARNPRIVEIAVIRIEADLHMEAIARRVNPEIPIPAAASRVHGITDRDVADCPVFFDVLPDVLDLLVGCDLTGFAIRGFDLPVIQAELARVGLASIDLHRRLVIDSMKLFHWYYPPPPETRGMGTLAAACRRYVGASVPGAHGAFCDALAALQVLDGQVAHHALPAFPVELAAIIEGLPEPERSANGASIPG
jgi:DNA polymerase-3 subunit epsilon